MEKKLGYPSNREFGYLFSTLSAAFTIYVGLKELNNTAILALIVTVTLLVITFFVPQLLTPLSLTWYGIGVLLGKIVNPIVLSLIFFLLLTPISLITRWFGRDELKIQKRFLESYWVDRTPPGPKSNSFRNQY